MNKPRKIKFGGPMYMELALAEFVYSVDLTPCNDCGGPVREGYCCTRCGSSTPETEWASPDETRDLFL